MADQERRKDESYEAQHVHEVYEQIASHFSATRYKPWPIVERFLKALPDGAVGLDVGCGNGKYLAVNSGVFIIGSDRSSNLIDIASRHKSHDVLVSDILDLPHPDNSVDFVISIAVVHHLSTSERRREAVKALMQPLKLTGRALIYVWALEQGSSRRGWTEQDEQDVMVPWVTRSAKKAADTSDAHQTFYRYYHLYRKGELEEDVRSVGGEIVEAGYEKDNWWAVVTKAPR